MGAAWMNNCLGPNSLIDATPRAIGTPVTAKVWEATLGPYTQQDHFLKPRSPSWKLLSQFNPP